MIRSNRRATRFLFFDPGVWSAALLAVGAVIVLRFTVFGRYCYAIGSNEATARLCGVGVERNKVVIYTLAGLLTGWAGVLAFAQTSASGDPTIQVGLELDVIAAVVIGGASLLGGQGSVVGVILGVFILGRAGERRQLLRRAAGGEIHPDWRNRHSEHGVERMAAAAFGDKRRKQKPR